MDTFSIPYQKMPQYELSSEDIKIEPQFLPESQFVSSTQQATLKDQSKSNVISDTDTLKNMISSFYKSKSNGPIQSYLSFMKTPKKFDNQKDQKDFYNSMKMFSFSNSESFEVIEHGTEFFCLLKSVDNETMLTGCRDHTIYLWDIKTRKRKGELIGHHSTIVSLAMSPDCKTLISGSYDKMIFLWDYQKLTKICELNEHNEGVVTLAVSPNGALFASGSDDKLIILWDLLERKKLKTLEGHTSAISTVLFTKDSQTLISSSWDTSIRIWNVETGFQEIILGEHDDIIRSIVLSNDSSILASAGADRVIKIWDLKERKQISCLEGHTDMIRTLAINSDATKLISGGRDRTIRVWDLKNMSMIVKMKGHRQIVRDLLLSSDEKFIVSVSADQTLRVWSLEVLDETILKGKFENVSALAISPEGKRIYSANSSLVVIWDLNTSKVLGKLNHNKQMILALAIAKGGELLLSAGKEGLINVWDVQNMILLKTLEEHQSSIISLKVTNDGMNFISGGSDRYLAIWNLKTYTHSKIYHDQLGPLNCLELSEDGKYVLTGNLTGQAFMWNYEEFGQAKIFNAHEKAVTAVKISPNNRKLITSSLDSKIKIWQTTNGALLYCLNAHTGPVLAIELNEEGTKLISGSEDGSIRLWDVRLGLPIGIVGIPMNSFKTLIMSPDGVRILAGLNEAIKIYEINQLHILKKIENNHSINAIILTNDEKSCITGGNDCLLRIWDINSMIERSELAGHSKPILTIKAFHEINNIASGSEDNTIRIWDIHKKEQVRLLKGSPSFVSSLAIFTDDQFIVSGCYDSTVRIWYLHSGNLDHIFKFHKGSVKALALTPDNKMYVSAGNDKIINVVNIERRVSIHQLKGHEDAVISLLIIKDGGQIISGSRDKTIRVWDLQSGGLVKILKSHRAAVTTMISNLNWTKMLTGAEDGTIHSWDLQNFKKCNNYNGHEKSVNGLAMISNEIRLFSVGSDQAIRVWRLEAIDLLPFLEGHSGRVKHIEMQSHNRLISISNDNSMILWDLSENKPFRKYLNKVGEIKCMCMRSDKQSLVLVTTDEIKIWDLNNWKQIDSIQSKNIAESIVITPDDKRCFIGCEDSYIRVWDLEEGQLNQILDGHLGAVTTLLYAKKRQFLISGGADDNIIIWENERLCSLYIFKGHTGTVSCLLIDREESKLISGSHDKQIKVWNLENCDQNPETIQILPYGVLSMIFTPNEKNIIVGCGKPDSYMESKATIVNRNEDYIHIFDYKSMKKIASLNNIENSSTLEISQSGETIISGSNERSISFWNINSLALEKNFAGHSTHVLAELMTNDCEKLILACDDKNIVVWNLKFTTLNTIFKGHKGNPLCLAVKQDGSMLVSGAKDKSIRVWSLLENKEIEVIEGHSAAVTCVKFTINDKILISGSDDCTIRLWNFEQMKIITVVDAHENIRSILDLQNGERFVTGDKASKIKIWSKKGNSNYELQKYIKFEAPISKVIASPNRKIILILFENFKIQTWKVKNWSFLTEIKGKQGNLTSSPIFLTHRLILYFDKIFDCYSGNMIFTFQINQEMKSFFYDINNSFYYFLSTENRLRKIEKPWLQSYFFNYMDYSSIGNLPQDVSIICRQNFCAFPFSLSFMHLISIFDKPDLFTKENMEIIYGKEEFCLKNFYQDDIFGNTPLDIMVLKKNPAFIIKYFDHLFKQFGDQNCNFNEKVRFLNYKFSKKKNILDLLEYLLPLLGNDLGIISRLLEISFMEIDSKIYNNDILYEELSKPLFIEADEIYTINKEMILQKMDEKLKVKGKDTKIYEKESLVKALIIAIPNLTDITNQKLFRILEHFSNLDSNNEFFANEVFKMIVNHIWITQIWRYYVTEFIVFLICFLNYNINHIFLIPAINKDPELVANQNLNIYLGFCDVIFMIYSLFCLVNETKQMWSSGIFNYFKNIWNYFDIALIMLLFLSSLVDFVDITNDFKEECWIKMIKAMCTFCLWFRFLSFFRAIKETSSMMRLIFNVIKSVRYFVLFMVFFMLTLASTFYLLHDGDEDANVFQALFAFYKSTVGDSSGIIEFKIVFPFLTNIFMIASTFLFAIILLNLLVAIIGDKHQEINEAEEKTRLFELTNIVVDTNTNLLAKIYRLIRKPKKRGNYLIYLYNESHEKNMEQQKSIEESIEENFKILKCENEKLIEEKTEQIKEFLKNRIDQRNVEKVLEEKMREMKSFLDNQFENSKMNQKDK